MLAKKINYMNNLHLSVNDAWQPKYLHYISAALITLYLTTVILATKQTELFGFTTTLGLITFPFVLMLGDIMSEIYGYKRSRQVIWLGFFAISFFTIVSQIALYLPPAPGWTMQNSFQEIFGIIPRITIASLITYLCADLVNSRVMTLMKVEQGSRGFNIRAVLSTVAGQGVDSFMFFILAFTGIWSMSTILWIAFTTWIAKILIEIICLPLTKRLVNYIKKMETVEHFDKQPKGEVILSA